MTNKIEMTNSFMRNCFVNFLEETPALKKMLIYPASEVIGFEIMPVNSDLEQCEVCKPSECNIISIYMIYANGERHVLTDLVTPESVSELFKTIAKWGM